MTPDIGTWVDEHIYDHHGYEPQISLNDYIGRALDYNDITTYSLFYPDERPLDSRDSGYDTVADCLWGFEDWIEQRGIKDDYDALHLIVDESSVDSGGINNGGKVSAGVGNYIEELNTYDPPRFAEMKHGHYPSTPGDQVHICMHEVGHDLGIVEDQGMHYVEDDVNWYVPYSDAAYSTPEQAGRDGSLNSCSETSVDPDNYSSEYCDAYWWYNCAGDELRSIWL